MVMGFSTGVESLPDWVLCCLISFDDWTTVVGRLTTGLRVVVGRLPTGPYVVVGRLTTGPVWTSMDQFAVVGRLMTGPHVVVDLLMTGLCCRGPFDDWTVSCRGPFDD